MKKKKFLEKYDMIKTDETSNAQTWELEVVCKSKKYLDKVVAVVLKYGMMEFEVNLIEVNYTHPEWCGRYSVLIWSCGFNNLANLSRDLKKVEKKMSN